MKIIITKINNCTDCPHLSHTGAFTKGGAKPCCTHKETIKSKGYNCFDRTIPYKIQHDERPITRKIKRIPDWCPLPNLKE